MRAGTTHSISLGASKKYGARIDGIESTHVFIIEYESRPIGWIQWYRWSDYPKHAAQLEAEPNAAGIDLAIGDVSVVGKGIGSSAICEFIVNVVSAEPGITAIVTDPEERNGPSCRAFEKSGFIPSSDGVDDAAERASRTARGTRIRAAEIRDRAVDERRNNRLSRLGACRGRRTRWRAGRTRGAARQGAYQALKY
jgi:hypothetical protein